jgi:hypothetical protein
MVSQKKSNNVTQLELPTLKPVERVAKPRPIDVISLLPTIRNISTLHRSIAFARELSGLQDKEIYDEVGIDPGAFSRMTAGSAWYPQDERWPKLMNKLGHLPLAWWCEAEGFDFSTMRKHQTDAEREADFWKKRYEQSEHEREIERRAVREYLCARR